MLGEKNNVKEIALKFWSLELKYPDNAENQYVMLNPFLGISVQLRLVFTVITSFMTDDEKFNEKSIT